MSVMAFVENTETVAVSSHSDRVANEKYRHTNVFMEKLCGPVPSLISSLVH